MKLGKREIKHDNNDFSTYLPSMIHSHTLSPGVHKERTCYLLLHLGSLTSHVRHISISVTLIITLLLSFLTEVKVSLYFRMFVGSNQALNGNEFKYACNGQWWWLSWLSGRSLYQKSAVQNQSSA